MKSSIKKQISFTCICLIAGTVFVCWLINVFFLGKYYIEGKKDDLISAYRILIEHAKEGEIASQEFDSYMQRFCNTYNISYIITDDKANTLCTSIRDERELNRQLYDAISMIQESEENILVIQNDYKIGNMIDPISQMEYITLWGGYEDTYYFMLRTSVEGVQASVRMVNMFLLYVGAGSTIVAAIIVDLMSSRITGPILELAAISEKMANFDFETKYKGKSKNEIGVLGENFNEMSEKLEATIRQLKNANLELQQDVENKALVDAQRREFLANVSHELKTPIALIQGYAEGLKEGMGDNVEDRNYYCDVIMDETTKMNKMVRQLLALNQLEFGENHLDLERFDLSILLQNAVNSMQFLVKEKCPDLVIHYDKPEQLYVWADEFKIDEVVRNFLTNAINHVNDMKQVSVSISHPSDEKVRVTVYNSGERIPEESLERLWEKFYKVDKARTRAYGGSGIGLSIVRAIMEAHGENYGVNNRDRGVEFYFELPTK